MTRGWISKLLRDTIAAENAVTSVKSDLLSAEISQTKQSLFRNKYWCWCLWALKRRLQAFYRKIRSHMSFFSFQTFRETWTITRPHYVLIVIDMRRTKYEGYEWSSENCTFKLHLKRPNISIKLNQMWLDALVVYFRLRGRLKHLFTKLLLTGGR